MAEEKSRIETSENCECATYPIQEETDITRKRWFNLREACALKSLNYKTAQNRRHLQPQFGKEDGRIGGTRCWRRATIEEWLDLTDDDIRQRMPSK